LALSALAVPSLAAPQALGDLLQAPDGSYYQLAAHQGGTASTWRLSGVTYGRLVNVYALDASGAVTSSPVLHDVVIHPDLDIDGVSYQYDESPVTQEARLVILAPFSGAAGASDRFVALLNKAQRGLPEIAPKDDVPGATGYSMVPRNAALVLRMDDLLADGEADELQLAQHVRTLVDAPAATPFAAQRTFFDPNHGAVVRGSFHSTRIVVDLTVSEVEASAMSTPAPINPVGLPASEAGSTDANVAIRIPTKVAPGAGQFGVLRNLAGNPPSPGGGPFDASSPTVDLVRAMRSGNGSDAFKGFLSDSSAPQILGRWAANVTAAFDDPAGTIGVDFIVSLTFLSTCAVAPQPGHLIEAPGRFLEVQAVGAQPDASGLVPRVKVRALGGPTTAGALLGVTGYVLPYQEGEDSACWLGVTPTPGTLPATDVAPNAQFGLRFSEPMDPDTVSPYDTFAILRAGHGPSAHEYVPASIVVGGDLTVFTSVPSLPLSHAQGTAETYRVWFGGSQHFTDLAGNAIEMKPNVADLVLDASAPSDANGGVVMRFSSLDEVQLPPAAMGASDLRGQVTIDTASGVVHPRAVTRFSALADRSQTVPGLMIPFAQGVQTPLNPLGAKLMNVWRYADVGMSSTDEAQHNLDVEGLAWAPVGGQVIADVFPEFEMRMSHSGYQPDEALDVNLLPNYPSSGLSKQTFADNVLQDPASPQSVVHGKALGYAIDPADLFTATSGTAMLPWPMNEQGGPYTSFLWRDTAVQAKAAPNGAGLDLEIMELIGLIPSAGTVALPGQVPSIGLPLLTEFRCYPSASSLGLNMFDVSLAINSSRLPAFRVYSAGGFNAAGQPVQVDPDLEPVPSGGFNPSSIPPGGMTPPEDNVYYVGQMDLVTRVSRAHTIWIDTGVSDGSTAFLAPQVLAGAGGQPAGTEVVVAFRGASAISGGSLAGAAFDAATIDPYGAVNLSPGVYLGTDNDVSFVPAGDATWKSDPNALAGSRYVQARVSFLGNAQTLESASMSSLAFAYDHQ